MDDLTHNVIVVIISVLIATGLVSFGYNFYQQNHKAANTITNAANTRMNNIKDQKYMDYDGTTHTGSAIARAVKKFQKNAISIQAEAQDGTFVSFIYNLSDDGLNLGSRTDNYNDNYDESKYSSSFPPSQKYISNLIYSESGAIIGIRFTKTS